MTFAMLDNNKMLSSGVIRLDRLIMLGGKDKYNQKENSFGGRYCLVLNFNTVILV